MYNYFQCIGEIKESKFRSDHQVGEIDLTLTLTKEFKNANGQFDKYDLTFKLYGPMISIFMDIENPIGKKASIKGRIGTRDNQIELIAERIIVL